MTILEQLEATCPGLERRFFLEDNRQAIEREIALHGFPRRPWNPEARWPHVARAWGPQGPAPSPSPTVTPSYSPFMQLLNALPMSHRSNFYRKNRESVLDELETFRGG